MKASDVTEFELPVASTISFRALSVEDLGGPLSALYLGLDFEKRRARFGCAVSDQSIITHCLALHLKQSLVLGCFEPAGLVAAIELHPSLPTWEEVEIAFVDKAATDRIMILGHLLQLAAFAAGRRGCNSFVISLGPSESDLRRLLRGMGRTRFTEECARVDLGEYARLRGILTGES